MLIIVPIACRPYGQDQSVVSDNSIKNLVPSLKRPRKVVSEEADNISPSSEVDGTRVMSDVLKLNSNRCSSR